MKPHEQPKKKTGTKQERKEGENKGRQKNQIKKGEKTIKR
jgi:hypothetical protein